MPELIDMHCHIIPGVDDGAGSKEDVGELLLMEYKSGVRKIILTPHYRKGMFEADEQDVRNGLEDVRRIIQELGIEMEVFLGCEYHANSEMIREISEDERFRMNGSRYVLVEFSSRHNFLKIRNWIYELVKAGFEPVIAHVERCPAVVEKKELVEELIELGAWIQVDAGAILGEDGWRLKTISRKLLKEELVHFIGSDAHDSQKRRPNLGECYSYVAKKVGDQYAQELFFDNPRVLLKSEK